MAGFMAGIIPVNALADTAPGFVWRLQDGDGPGATALRPCGPDVMVNMSVWEDLESLRNFVYRNGPHLDFMRRRRSWFHPMAVAYLVLWWVPAGHSRGLTMPGSGCHWPACASPRGGAGSGSQVPPSTCLSSCIPNTPGGYSARDSRTVTVPARTACIMAR